MLGRLTKMLPGYSLIKDIQRTFGFLRKTEVSMKYFSLSVLFSVGLTMFNIYVVTLLFPLIDGIIKADFSSVREMRVVGSVARSFPSVFHSNSSLFLLLVAWVYASTIAKNALSYAAYVTMSFQSKKASARMRLIIMRRYFRFGKKFFDRNNASTLNNILMNSTSVIDSQLITFEQLTSQALTLLVFLGMMLAISWQLTVAVAIIFPLVGLATRALTKRIHALSMSHTDSRNTLGERIFDILTGMTLVKGFGKEEEEARKFERASQEEIRESFRIQSINYLAGPIQDLSSTTGLLFAAWAMAAIGAVSGIPASRIFVFFFLATRVMPTMNSINTFRLNLARSAGPLSELDRVMDDSEKFIVPEGEDELGSFEKEVRVAGLDFCYSPGTPVLRNLRFSIEKGKMTAIVGPTGSGKSTIANIILRFYDVPSGTVLIDGKDIRGFKISSVRKRIAFVSQDIILFNGSIHSNICYGRNDTVSEEEFADITSKAGVKDFAEKLPEKFQTKVGERGVKLSGGEKQRIAIARALLRKADILILDEATSSLDSETERGITESMASILKGKTVIVIAHRLSTIRHADKIIVIENGSAVEEGTFDELINAGGRFHRYWSAQKF